MKRVTIGALALLAASYSAAWTQWAGNGHYYMVVEITGTDMSWDAARSQAQALANPTGGLTDLATLTSAAENDFVFSLVDSSTYWAIDSAGNNEGPYLGGFQPAGSAEPSGGWQWVTGETWSFTNWSGGEPNNFGGDESRLVFFGPGGPRNKVWNDVGNHPSSIIRWYVAESVVPEPGTMAVLGLGAAALIRKRRKQ